MPWRELNRWLYRPVVFCALALPLPLACSVYDDGRLNKRLDEAIASDAGPARDGAASPATGGRAGTRAAAGSPSREGAGGRSGQAAARDASTGPAQGGESPVADSGGMDAAESVDAGVTGAADGGAQCVTDSTSNYCFAIPALLGAPVIDGELECGLRLMQLTPEGWTGSGQPSKTASYAVAWRPDGLYLYVEVHGATNSPHASDQPIYCGDAVELFADADANFDDAGVFDSTGTMQLIVAAPASQNGEMEAMRFVQGVSQGAWISKSLKTRRLPNDHGYSIEAFLAASDLNLGDWMPSMRVGFSLGIDVAGTGGSSANGCTGRAGAYFLRVVEPQTGCNGQPWCDVRAFCRPGLRSLAR